MDKITDEFLLAERKHPVTEEMDANPIAKALTSLDWTGVERIYQLPNGYGLSAVNVPALHSYPFAWEIAVIKFNDQNGFDLVYDTPLTDDVLVFATAGETNEFIAKAAEWAAQVKS